jgi:hypothetical protein
MEFMDSRLASATAADDTQAVHRRAGLSMFVGLTIWWLGSRIAVEEWPQQAFDAMHGRRDELLIQPAIC